MKNDDSISLLLLMISVLSGFNIKRGIPQSTIRVAYVGFNEIAFFLILGLIDLLSSYG
jgi:hypothetical protein